MAGVTSVAVIGIEELAVIVAVNGLLNADSGADDQVGGIIVIGNRGTISIGSYDGSGVGGVIINRGVVVEFHGRRTVSQVECRAEVVAVRVGDGDIGEIAVTAIGDDDLPVAGVTSVAVILIEELAVIVAVNGLLNADIGRAQEVAEVHVFLDINHIVRPGKLNIPTPVCVVGIGNGIFSFDSVGPRVYVRARHGISLHPPS